MDNKLLNFSVQVYGEFESRNETTSICRCRIFYKGLNRNGSFISNEFAEKLLKTLPYTPVKGIYSKENQDYSTHGMENSEGRIYGVVPENPNVTWEDHLDEDGINRTYACCDVLIYTALYEEAGEILEKPESMELYPPSIKGQWINIQGQKAYQFTDGCFFGLQVLGDEVEPCFEGAAFFTLNDKVEQAFEKLKKLEATFELNDEGGNIEMQKMNFKLSEGNEIYQELFELLNPNFNEEGNWEVNYAICKVADEYALVMNYESGEFEKIEFKKKCNSEKEEDTEEKDKEKKDGEEPEKEEDAEDKKEEDDKKKKEEEDNYKKKCNCELGETSTCYMITVSESEKTSLESIKELNGGSFEKIEEVFVKVPELENRITEIENKNSEFEQKIAESETEFTTLKTEKEELEDKFNLSCNELETAKAELENLKSYKLEVEKAKKQSIIDKYSEQLDVEIISKYTADTELDIIELEKTLAFELVKSTPSLFSKSEDEGYVPSEVIPTGLEAILNKYKK